MFFEETAQKSSISSYAVVCWKQSVYCIFEIMLEFMEINCFCEERTPIMFSHSDSIRNVFMRQSALTE